MYNDGLWKDYFDHMISRTNYGSFYADNRRLELPADKIKSETLIRPAAITPKKIIHNGPATIVIWRDGEKTVVKLMEGDTYDEYAAFSAALAKKIFGSTGYVKRKLKDVTVEQDTKITKKDLHLLAIDENSLVNLAKRILNNK